MEIGRRRWRQDLLLKTLRGHVAQLSCDPNGAPESSDGLHRRAGPIDLTVSPSAPLELLKLKHFNWKVIELI